MTVCIRPCVLQRRAALFLFSLCLLTGPAFGMDKNELLDKYRKKYVIALGEGVVLGFCPDRIGSNVAITVKGGDEPEIRSPRDCAVEPVLKGEVLRVTALNFM